ncbi:MAG: FAD-binding oxidoreductase [Desulfobacteraceae bacterium]|nr:MAG: FAD-binding oxidoreductase [Desulfobacteraceae bacterium]
MNKSYDIVVIGGGIIGSSISYNLMNDGFDGSILVIEKDPTYELASTTLSAGGAREQFSLPENIKISQYSIGIFENFDNVMEVDGEKAHAEFKQHGYLFLANEKNWPMIKKNYEIQKGLGAGVSLLSVDEVKKLIPHLKTDDLVGGAFGSRDGSLDPYGALQGYKRKGKKLGVEYLYEEVIGVEVKRKKVEAVTTHKGRQISCGIVVIAAGPSASIVGKMAGIDLPVDPVRKMAYVFDPKMKFDYNLPLVIDTDGLLYFRHESGKTILTGKSIPDEPAGFNFEWDRDFYMDVVWPQVAERVPAFETARLIRGWAGHYAMNRLDGNAIVGRFGDIEGFYGAVGFSGHGLQQAPAIGKCLSELIQFGEYRTIDLSRFSFDRFRTGKLVFEEEMV